MTGGEALSLKPAMMIGNRFRLQRVLGRGGMGSVWVASHTTLGIDVAIKFIEPELAEHPEIKARFAREAMAAAKIQSPHVVNILDYGTADDGRPYIAMELLRGEDLGARLDRVTKLPLADVTKIGLQACRGLSKAHAAGVIHRDLKPENLFLCEDDDGIHVKILDFGIAKAHDVDSVQQTAAGLVLGTPYYMSPEQAIGGTVDHRTDLYALAAVLFHALAGRVPLDAPSLGEMIVALTTEAPPPLSWFRSGLPQALDAFMVRGLAKKSSDRFSSAREMADALTRAVATSIAPTPLADWSSSFKIDDLDRLEDEAQNADVETDSNAALTDRQPILAESGITVKPPSAAPVSDGESTVYTGGLKAEQLRDAMREAETRASSIPPPAPPSAPATTHAAEPILIVADRSGLADSRSGRASAPPAKARVDVLPILGALLVLLAAIVYALTR